jgi:hypothetical protein
MAEILLEATDNEFPEELRDPTQEDLEAVEKEVPSVEELTVWDDPERAAEEYAEAILADLRGDDEEEYRDYD